MTVYVRVCFWALYYVSLIYVSVFCQHYDAFNLWNELSAQRNNTTPEYELEQIKYRDSIKQEHAIQSGYTFLIIPYYLEDNDKYKEIIDNTIQKLK